MLLRYRTLARSFDWGAYLDIVRRSRRLESRRGRRYQVPNWNEVETHGEDGAVEALLSAPRAVTATEDVADLETLQRLIREGRVSEHDLVDAGQGWQTVGSCVHLEDAVVARRRTVRWWRAGLLAGAVVLLGEGVRTLLG